MYAPVRHRAPARGFTLIEVLLVVVIIGAMASIAIPGLSRTIRQERVRKIQVEVASDLEFAFAAAARSEVPITVTYSSSTSALSIANRVTGTVLRTRYLGRAGDFSLTGVTLSPSAGMVIFPMGISNSTLSITLTNGNYSRTVSVTRAGQVTKS
ncbi:MAG: prepilin-type N-terminal cleavage/methylation domain-containing protein [Gemmatimonadaceae bacterium]|nr:prepilin-type N-terminal cleavage/methylation domain-containing protein [Gemmatimonadaceae bacterium]